MAYNPHTWATGETITAAHLNALEQGLSNAAGAGVSDAAVAAQVTAGAATQAALKAAYAPISRGPLTIVLGDSVDAGSDLWNYYSAGSIFSDLCILSGQRVKWLGNAGVPGNTTAQVLARVQSDAIAYNPGIVIIGGGVTNDHGQGIAAATTRANLTAIRDALRAAGITVVARTAPPNDNTGGAPFDTVSKRRAAIQQHNAWLRAWANASGIPVLDYYGPLVDETTGGYLAGLSDDGTHPSTAGQLAVAHAVVNAGLPACFTGTAQLTQSVGDAADLLGGIGLFLGALSGGVPAGWDKYGNDATVTVVNDTAIPGNWVQVTGGTNSIQVVESSGIDGKWAIGDVLEFAARVKFSGAAAGANIRLTLTDQAGGHGNVVKRIEPAAGTRAVDGIACGRVTVPAGAISGYVEFVVNFGETASVAQVTLTNLTALGAA